MVPFVLREQREDLTGIDVDVSAVVTIPPSDDRDRQIKQITQFRLRRISAVHRLLLNEDDRYWSFAP